MEFGSDVIFFLFGQEPLQSVFAMMSYFWFCTQDHGVKLICNMQCILGRFTHEIPESLHTVISTVVF